MKNRKKLLAVLAALLVFSLVLSGCAAVRLPQLAGAPGSSPSPIPTMAPILPTLVPEPTVVPLPDPTEEPLPTPEPTPEVTPEPTPESPSFSSLYDLAQHLHSEIEQDHLIIDFQYTGDPDDLSAQTLAQITAQLYVSLTTQGSNCHAEFWTYPGDNILRAHQSGATAWLSDDEYAAYQRALEVVSECTRYVASDYELELALHDWICDHVDYNDVTRTILDPDDPPRNLTAVGALLDGQANCQGYTDAFYLLASLAGFQVGRVYVHSPDDDHVTNTIRLNSRWYVVDATFDDVVIDGQGVITHKLFNAGKDMCCEYTWGLENEYHEIASSSDENYYFFRDKPPYECVFYDVNAMASTAMYNWRQLGWNRQELALLYCDYSWTELDKALVAAAQGGPSCRWYIYYFSNGRDTFYRVEFS